MDKDGNKIFPKVLMLGKKKGMLLVFISRAAISHDFWPGVGPSLGKRMKRKENGKSEKGRTMKEGRDQRLYSVAWLDSPKE